MDHLSLPLLLAAASVAAIHTAAGPDHYVPFVALARARGWGWAKTMWITAICGFGHCLGAVLLGLLALLGLSSFVSLEEHRGDWVAWAIVAFGTAYALWGLRQGLRQQRGYQLHAHDEHGGDLHVHARGGHSHVHGEGAGKQTTFWALFLIFVFGPCEPMIALVVIPGLEGRVDQAVGVGLVFTVVTIASMMAITAVALAGLKQIRFAFLERWMHGLSGAVIAASGLAIIYLGL